MEQQETKEIKLLTVIIEKVIGDNHELRNFKVVGALTSAIEKSVHLALEIAAMKADMLVTKGDQHFIAAVYNSNFPDEPRTTCMVNRKSIMDIEKLFI